MGDIKLKDPHVVRLFISSPFNGMEKERDILTKFYWPKIESALSAKGLHLKLVDMRWGITHSSSSASQTVNICLKEIDRSDIFIGLFGQRYGWNGRNDPELQENFNKAAEKYPWVDQYRDRSVTEVEFMHGHLNNPGNMPACFCFRDKTYDDKMRKEAELKGNAKKQRNFQAEDENSFKKLESLKGQVHATESKTLGVAMHYKGPQEAADFVYNKVWKYIEDEVIAKIEKPVSEKEKVTLAHKAYQASQCGFHVGKQKYFDEFENYVNNTEKEQHVLTITGPTGCGKTSLLSNWIQDKTKESLNDANKIIYYHFVGAEQDSIVPRFLITRLIDHIQSTLNGEGFEYKPEKKLSLPKLTVKMVETLDLLKLDEHKDKQLIIIIDNISRISLSKTSMPLFWLPKNLPINVRVILSFTEGAPKAEELLEILTDVHKAKMIRIDPLGEIEKREMCSQLLEENSKSMDNEQLLMLTSSERTNNPFFLKILVNELCIAGRFRQLTQQINNLLDSDGILGLLVKVIERIEEDYSHGDYAGNVVEEILCALCLCKKGISESEFPMAQHIWAPVIYAIKTFLIDRDGILAFAFPEMFDAVKHTYMPTEERERAMAKVVSDIFFAQYESCVKEGKKIDERIASELLHLLKLSNDKRSMKKVLGDIRMFESLGTSNNFQLNEYWQWLGTTAAAMANYYARSLDSYVAEEYAAYLDHCEMDRWPTILKKKSDLMQDLRKWFEDSKLYNGVRYLLDRELELDRNRPGISIMKRKEYICVLKYQKACFLSDIEQYDEALESHREVVKLREELIKASAMDKEDMALSYHGTGLCHYNLKNMEESEKYYNMSLEIEEKDPDKKANMSNTYCNLGLVSLNRKDYDKALEHFNKANALREEAEPNRLSLEIAYNYHNIALTYRRMKQYDDTEKYYLKSLKIKEDLLGRDSYDVGLTIMNLGSLEVARKNHVKSLEYAQEALRILKIVCPEGSFRPMMAQENMVNELTHLDRYEEAEPLYKEVRAFLKTPNGKKTRFLPPLCRRFCRWYLDKDKYEEALELALDLVERAECKPQDYAYLGLADDGMYPPLKKKPERQEEYTLDYGLKKFPLDRDILLVKFDILNRRSPSKLIPFICEYCENEDLPKNAEERYAILADILKDDTEELNKAIELLEKVTTEKTDRPSLLEKLESFKALKTEESKKKADDSEKKEDSA